MRFHATRWVLAAAVCLAAVGCGDGYEGSTYVDAQGAETVTFKGDKKANVTVMGTTVETEYAVDDHGVTLKAPPGQGANLVLKRNDDGTLDGGMLLGKLKKK